MRRRFYTALVSAMLVGASLQAPFAHVHPGDPDHHHATGFVHDHLAVHEHHDEGTEIEAHDDDEFAIFLEWAPAAAQRVVVTYFEVPATPAVEPTMALVGAAPEFTPRANSPPGVRLLPARSPPF